MPADLSPVAPFVPTTTPAARPEENAVVPGKDDGNIVAAQQQLAQRLLALMAALMSAAQSSSTPNMESVQSAAKQVLASLPQGQNPQWLTSVTELAENPAPTAAQVQAATSTLQSSLLNILPQTDPHAAGNRHHHPKGRTKSLV